MINLVDGDLITYPCAASCEPTKAKPFLEPPEVALFRLHDLIQRICKETNTTDCEFYISGEDNFRKKIYPEYKANRTKPPPTYLQECREILVTQYGATIVNGMETDDMLGIRQTQYDGSSRICTIDKDLMQVPGYHYNWKKGTTSLVSPLDGLKTFYKQLIAGDGTDNIPSYDGKVRNSVPKFIEKLQQPIDFMTDELEMYDYVCTVYLDSWCEANIPGEALSWEFDYGELHRNAQLVYILREEDVFWKPPNGLKDE